LLAGVVGNACVVNIDGDALDGHLGSAASLPHGNHHLRLQRLQQLAEHFVGFAEDGRQLSRDDLGAGDSLAIEGAHGFPRRIDGFVLERVETGDEDGRHDVLLLAA